MGVRQQKLEDYAGFVEKFERKRTTDDCMTPPKIYEAIKGWVCEEYGVAPEKIVRPFWPDGNYEAFSYADGAVVVDNPPFSILSQIVNYYLDNAVPFFLFAPSLTMMSHESAIRCNHIVCDTSITYENGAKVKTAFVTSFGFPTVLQTSPELQRRIEAAEKTEQKEKKTEKPTYEYPMEIITAAMMQRYARNGLDIRIRADEAVRIGCLDAQKKSGKSIFGGGLLLSRAAAERREKATCWELSEREKEIVRWLSQKKPDEENI